MITFLKFMFSFILKQPPLVPSVHTFLQAALDWNFYFY